MGSTSGATVDTDGNTELLAYFFLTLPESMRLPHGYIAQFGSDESFGRDDDTIPSSPGLLIDGGTRRLTGSVAIHQDQRVPSSQRTIWAFEVMARAFLWGPADSRGATTPPPGLPMTSTTAEVMVPIDSDSPLELERAFGLALDYVGRVQRAYYAASQHAVPILTAAALPPVLPVAVRRAFNGEDGPAWPTRNQFRLWTNFASSQIEGDRPVLGPDTLDALARLTSAGRDGPFGPLLDVRQELALVRRAGGTIPSAILCGATAEVLLREILLLLWWEEGRSPSSVQQAISGVNMAKLVRNQFHPRLGGSWSTSDKGVIAEWECNVATLRNRAVHAGYRPSNDEVELAVSTLEAVEHFVGDRLAASIDQFPLTAQFFLGSRGIARRNVQRALTLRLENDFVPADPPAVFARWRREVQRYMAKGPWVGNSTAACPILLIYLDGTERWWLVDDSAGLACVGQEPELTASQSASLSRLRSELSTTAAGDHVAIRCAGRSRPIESPPKWLPLHDVFPLHAISRHPVSILPPR